MVVMAVWLRGGRGGGSPHLWATNLDGANIDLNIRPFRGGPTHTGSGSRDSRSAIHSSLSGSEGFPRRGGRMWTPRSEQLADGRD